MSTSTTGPPVARTAHVPDVNDAEPARRAAVWHSWSARGPRAPNVARSAAPAASGPTYDGDDARTTSQSSIESAPSSIGHSSATTLRCPGPTATQPHQIAGQRLDPQSLRERRDQREPRIREESLDVHAGSAVASGLARSGRVTDRSRDADGSTLRCRLGSGTNHDFLA